MAGRMTRAAGFMLACLLLGLPVSAAAQSFGEGLAAYDGGRYGEAAEIFRTLAEEGHDGAMMALAGLYADGLGVRRDQAEASRLYLEAAKAGNVDAMRIIGDRYARGLGVERDPEKARTWLSRAAEAGSEWAKNRLDTLN